MNYLTEIKLFYDWLDTHNLSPRAIALWHGLMFIANRSGWQRQLPISLSAIEARTHIPRASIYREREHLRDAGLIEFSAQGSRFSSLYTLHSLEEYFAFRNVSHSETQNQDASQNASQGDTHNDTQKSFASQDTSHCDTQPETQKEFVSQNASQIETHSETIYKLNYTESIKEKTEKENQEVKKQIANRKSTPRPPSMDTSSILSTIDPPWRELMHAWLEYKRVRKETYKSEIGIRKCLSNLRELSGGNHKVATLIIDQSIANNWAGLFPLRSGAMARGQPIAGQHPGQIKQPESETKRQELLNKLKPKK